MRREIIALLFLILSVSLLTRPAYAQRLIGKVDLKSAKDHYVTVSIKPMQLRPDTMSFQMATWAPGVYGEVHYGRFVKDFKALDLNGAELKVKRVNDDRWRIIGADKIGEIRYQIVDSRNDDAAPTVGLAHIDNDAVLANGVSLFGYVDDDKNIPLTITYSLPQDWMIATPLEPATEDDITSVQSRLHQTIYSVDSYEDLADAPVLAAPNSRRVFMWHDGSVNYFVVAAGNPAFPVDSFAAAARKISRAETTFFHNVPYDEYMFLVYADPGAGATAAIAHSAASVYNVHGADWGGNRADILHTVAATMFQTWNGKRFHISTLGPVDYSAPLQAKSLWFNEGVSDYYADLLLARYGITPSSAFFSAIDRWTQSLESSPKASLESLSEKLTRYDAATIQALRTRGALTALLMDIELRSHSNNRRSLDALLTRMNADAKSGKTYDDNALIQTISKYTQVDLSKFYTQYIAGNDTPPVEQYLNEIGASQEEPVVMPISGPLGFEIALNKTGTAIISNIPKDTEVVGADLHTGDTVASINGSRVTPIVLTNFTTSLAEGQLQHLQIVRSKRPVSVTVKAKPVKVPRKKVPVTAMKKASRKQLVMRKALLGRRQMKRG